MLPPRRSKTKLAIEVDPFKKRDTTKFDNWPLELGPHITGVEAQRVRIFICSY